MIDSPSLGLKDWEGHPNRLGGQMLAADLRHAVQSSPCDCLFTSQALLISKFIEDNDLYGLFSTETLVDTNNFFTVCEAPTPQLKRTAHCEAGQTRQGSSSHFIRLFKLSSGLTWSFEYLAVNLQCDMSVLPLII